MKTALITGVTGQDGSYLAEFLLDKGYKVYGLVRISSANNRFRLADCIKNDNFYIIPGDMTDESSLYKAVLEAHPDEIYNLAAQSHVGLSACFSEYTTNVNALGVLRLFNVISNLKLENSVKIYQALTSDIFGNIDENIMKENTEISPVNIYACSKAYALLLARMYRNKGFFIVNGISFAHESQRRPEIFVTRKVTKSAVRIKYGKQKKLSLGNLSVRRDWGHAKDFVRGMYLSMQQQKPDDYIFATGITTSLRDLCIKAFNLVGIELTFEGEGINEKGYNNKTGELIIDVDAKFIRPNEKINPTGDYSKAKKVLGWEPKYTIDNILEEMISQDLKEEV